MGVPERRSRVSALALVLLLAAGLLSSCGFARGIDDCSGFSLEVAAELSEKFGGETPYCQSGVVNVVLARPDTFSATLEDMMATGWEWFPNPRGRPDVSRSIQNPTVEKALGDRIDSVFAVVDVQESTIYGRVYG